MHSWKLSPSIGVDRVQALETHTSLREIAAKVAEEMEVLCCHCVVCDDNCGFARVVYCIKVPAETFDLFFNSVNGYRAAYYRSQASGLNANSAIVRRLSPALLEWSVSHSSGIDVRFARESLDSPSAKIWLAENGKHLCRHCEGEWSYPANNDAEIINGRWEKNNSSNGICGRKAPGLTKLRIFGAFLSENYDEFVPAGKRFRATDIHACGWS